MWIVFGIAVALVPFAIMQFWLSIADFHFLLRAILAFAAFHIYLAVMLPLPFVIYYVCALAFPIFFMASAYALVYESTHNMIQLTSYCIRGSLSSWKSRKSGDEENNHDTDGEPTAGSSTAKDPQGTSNIIMTDGFSPVALHLHHWQIFYVLCFFTRYVLLLESSPASAIGLINPLSFDHPVSQVAAGIVLACYMQGICACRNIPVYISVIALLFFISAYFDFSTLQMDTTLL